MRPRQLHTRWLTLACAAPLVLGLTGCSLDFGFGDAEPDAAATDDAGSNQSDPADAEADQQTDADSEPSDSADETPSSDDTPAAAEADCGWGEPPLPAEMPVTLPEGQDGDLADVLIGAWQHTHYDTGSGFESVTRDGVDIRFVFPSTTEMIYCQDVEGATDEASQAAPLTIDGDELILPEPATGYRAIAWNHDTMLWENHFDGSAYLLQRR